MGCTRGETDRICYDSPAERWTEAIPVGNGRLAMMVYGNPLSETLALNESSLWSGEYNPNANPVFGKERLDSLRRIFMRGDIAEGNRIASRYLVGDISSFGTHLPMGDVKIDMGIDTFSDYSRSLCLNEAIARTSFAASGIRYRTEAFASNPDDVLVWHIEADKRKSVNLSVRLDLLREAKIEVKDNRITYSGKVSFPKQGRGGVGFCGQMEVVQSGGTLSSTDSSIIVSNASEVTIYSDIRTDYYGLSAKRSVSEAVCTLSAQRSKSYSAIRRHHISDFSELYNRAHLTIQSDQPSDWRIQNTDRYADRVQTDTPHGSFAPESGEMSQSDRGVPLTSHGSADRSEPDEDKNHSPLTPSLFFNFSRYLFLSASRANSPLPVALQGMFNDNLACNMPWTNDYHLDINTEQNYWLANVGNMAESNEPLLHYIEHLALYGAETAEKVYGCRGWCAHTIANVFGFTAPSSAIGWGLFPTAGSWLATHLWTHYQYTLDRDWLCRAYPLLKGNALFLLDYMMFDTVSGYLLTGPSISPENGFLYEGQYQSASMMPTVDRVLVHEILSSTAQAATILGVDSAFADSCREALALLPPLQIGAKGQLQEWLEDYEEAVPNHRHTSHMLALYPFRQITIEHTPELAEAARVSLENRLNAPHWEDTEWSRPNAICYYARLGKAEEAYRSVEMLLRQFLSPNMLTVSPAGIASAEEDIFCIDGNTAGAAGIAEMLLQSNGNEICVLPCLPEEWHSGSFRGFCAHNGITVDACWKNHHLTSLTLHNGTPSASRLDVKYALFDKKSIILPPNSTKRLTF